MAKPFAGIRSVHYQQRDPGTSWVKDDGIVVDLDPSMDSRKLLTPNVIQAPEGGYRLFDTSLVFGRSYADSSVTSYQRCGNSFLYISSCKF